MANFLENLLITSQTHVWKSPAIDYLYSRGVTDEQIRSIGIGYFPEEVWPPYLKHDTDDRDIQDYLQWSSKGNRLRGKLVFPMRNPMGTLRGIQLRSPDRSKKDYTKYYLSRSKVDAVFFGSEVALPTIWEKRSVYICEGLFDFFPLQRVFPNTLCTGTANVSHRQIEFLTRFVDHVTVVFDMDGAGDEFWIRFQERYGDNFITLDRLTLRGKDVSEVWEKVGEEEMQKILLQSQL